MNRPRLVRGIKITWTVFCGIACVLLIVLWVRSYWRWDAAWKFTPATELDIDTQNGEAFLRYFSPPVSTMKTTIGVGTKPALDIDVMPPNSHAGFCFRRGGQSIGLFVPFWFLTLITAPLAVAPWITWRFTLRTLLIVTTLVAVVLG